MAASLLVFRHTEYVYLKGTGERLGIVLLVWVFP